MITPKAEPNTPIDELYALMSDEKVPMRDRFNAARSASRVETLAMPGQPEPRAVRWLRSVIAQPYSFGGGNNALGTRRQAPHWRREASEALAYYERRAKRAQLQYNVADSAERIQGWRRVINGLIRTELWRTGRWPAEKHLMIGPRDPLNPPPGDPERALDALLAGSRQSQRRQRKIDEPMHAIASPEERREILDSLAAALSQRLAGSNGELPLLGD